MKPIESYAAALRWLYARNQFAIKLGLESPRELLRLLGNPEAGLPFLHVAGTNGKGSVCTNLAAMLPAIGFQRVGLYTSPHLVSFRERIRVDGAPVPPAWVTDWLNAALPAMDSLNSTYFECVTAMALAWFKANDCGAVVLETGLGGRLDATNVVAPRVCAITSISLDHTAILGGTLEAIWGEKLGIVKPGVPLIVDEDRPAFIRQASRKALEAGAAFINLADRLIETGDGWVLRGRWREYALPRDLRPEPHQIRNAALSVLTLESFLGEALPAEEIWVPALAAARLAGRTQWVESAHHLPVLLDGAHNPAGVEALVRHVSGLGRGKPRIFFAVMRDKEFLAVYRQLRTLSDDIVYLDLGARFPRALTLEELREVLSPEEGRGLRGFSMDWESLEPLLRPGSGADYAVACGSLFLLGEVIPLLVPRYQGLEEFAVMMREDTAEE